jgi:hypothetical protein
MAIMLVLVLVLWRIRTHYTKASRQLGRGLDSAAPVTQQFFGAAAKNVAQTVVIPVDEINLAVLRTVAYARSISPNTTAVHVSLNRDEAEELRRKWEESVPDVPFVVVDSPYRSLVEPFLAYVNALDRTRPGQIITVVLPEFVPRRPWERLLHNQLALRLKRALLSRHNVVLVDVPYHFTE